MRRCCSIRSIPSPGSTSNPYALSCSSAGIEYHVEPHLVRGLDYYTRTVFEWTTEALGSQSTVCAGGRYDGLVAQLGGTDTPGVGWAMGQERIVMLLQKQNLALPKDRPQIYLVLAGEQAEIPGFKLAEQLRDAWPDLAVQINLGGGSFKTQFKRADKSGAEFALVLGDDEAGPRGRGREGAAPRPGAGRVPPGTNQ